MFLDTFHTPNDGSVSISAAQASQFAKQMADDFNPIHDEDAKRFCVPGDLLFALVLSRYGVSEQMSFSFGGMVGANTSLIFPREATAKFSIDGDNNKTYLSVEQKGETTTNVAFIESFVRQYVAFSGQNFPHILVPLMRNAKVMIHPGRPLVIYESMSFELNDLSATAPVLKLSNTTIDINGKRGDVGLFFDIESNGLNIGRGVKKLVLGSLREFDEEQMQKVCDHYDQRKRAFSTV